MSLSSTHLTAITRVCLIRHGETDWNAEGRLQGTQDIPLNAAGLRQARAAARALCGQRFDAIYSSDLARARVTAEIIAAELGLPVQLNTALRERHFGPLQALTHAEAAVQHSELHQRIRARETALRPAGGESLEDLLSRVQTVLETLATQHAGQTLLIVSHGGVLDIAYRVATGRPLGSPRDFTLNNASINWLAHSAQGWQMLGWAQTAHLQASQDELPV